MARGEPSREYPYVFVPDDFDAFSSKEAAIREAKRRWAAQQPAQRTGFFIAKILSYVEPDYEIDHEETLIDPPKGAK
jgi:hypothetical protein